MNANICVQMHVFLQEMKVLYFVAQCADRNGKKKYKFTCLCCGNLTENDLPASSLPSVCNTVSKLDV